MDGGGKPDAETGSYGIGAARDRRGRGRRLNGRPKYSPREGSRSGRPSRRQRRKMWIFRLLLVAAVGVAVWIVFISNKYHTSNSVRHGGAESGGSDEKGPRSRIP